MDSDSPDIPHKQCGGPCKQSLPATTEFFYREKSKRYGVSSICKTCRKAAEKVPREIIPPAPGSMKQCSVCKLPFPATNQYFAKDRGAVDGLNAGCKVCRNKYKKESRATPQEQEKAHGYYVEHRAEYRARERRYYRMQRIALGKYPKIIPELKAGEKWCPGCERVLPATPDFFPRNKNYSDGLHGRCKKCAKVYSDEHKEQMQPYYRQYRQEHKGEIRRYRQEHIIKLTAYDRQYYAAHVDKIRERHKRYLQTEKGKLVRRTAYIRYMARKKGIQGTWTTAQIQEQLKRQKYRCYYAACGHAKFKREKGRHIYQIEHTFPVSRVIGTDIPANDISYLVLACPSCNINKGNKFPWEWIEGGRLL